MFRKIVGNEKFTARRVGRGGRAITTFCQRLLSHSDEKFRRGTFLCFTKILVSKDCMNRTGGRGGKE